MIRTYSELSKLETFDERFNYLKLNSTVGKETFGLDRYLNQVFYRHREWKRIRSEIIIRDNGCDLGIDGLDIQRGIIVHHMNPITINDIEEWSAYLMEPEYLICTSLRTHNAIHYGDINLLNNSVTERLPNDTCPWKG